jgi:hypothetical protein
MGVSVEHPRMIVNGTEDPLFRNRLDLCIWGSEAQTARLENSAILQLRLGEEKIEH